MAINNEYPILDGIAPSWGDMSVKISGTEIALLEMKDINAINTNMTLEDGEQRNAGGRVVRRTVGQDTNECSLTLYRFGVQNLYRGLLANAPRRGNQALISLVFFDIDYQHTPPGTDEIFQRVVYGCRVKGSAMNAALGTDAQTVEMPIGCAKIADIVDGVEVVLI